MFFNGDFMGIRDGVGFIVVQHAHAGNVLVMVVVARR
jgi:hypothetical protein